MTQPAEALQPVRLTLPDGSVRAFDHPVTGFELAESIGAGLAKAALAVKVDGQQRDLSQPIEDNAHVSILTAKDEEGLDVMRHTLTAQVLALAVKELWPEAKLAIGPTIEHGFYYDIDLDYHLTPDDLPKLEAKMQEILARKQPVQREMWDRAEAMAMFRARGETYKAELIEQAGEDDTTEPGKISLYRQGEGEDAFIDLCRGPHAPDLGRIPGNSFKLTRLAGAYWRGDSKNKMLQRIYGVAFADKKALAAHLRLLEEAEKRDHRRLGREMDLFHFEDSAPGQPFWHHNGWMVYNLLIDYMRRKIRAHGYTEVNSPQMLDVSFWKYSGHWDKYRDNMFVVNPDDPHPSALKPMSCPGNVQIYKSSTKSYRDLPVRMAEFGKVFRNEPAGARHGLMRVQGFTQDDAHIFCTPQQLEDEVVAMCDLIRTTYEELGLTDVRVMFSTRPEQRIGSEEDWDRAEAALQKVCDRINMKWELNEGDGAFYAPKLDFVVKDAIGRDWQCGTIQVDMNLPARLDITYIGEDGGKHRPHMVHRAIFGSIERFMGILIEHHAGKFPLWLAPLQAVICPITNEQDEYATLVAEELRAVGMRVSTDLSANKINYKVRDHSTKKVPLILAVGPKDEANKTVAVRRLGQDGQEILALDDAIAKLKESALPPA